MLTGRATDSRCPQSITSPVIRPTASNESKWLDANDTDGTFIRDWHKQNRGHCNSHLKILKQNARHHVFDIER